MRFRNLHHFIINQTNYFQINNLQQGFYLKLYYNEQQHFPHRNIKYYVNDKQTHSVNIIDDSPVMQDYWTGIGVTNFNMDDEISLILIDTPDIYKEVIIRVNQQKEYSVNKIQTFYHTLHKTYIYFVHDSQISEIKLEQKEKNTNYYRSHYYEFKYDKTLRRNAWVHTYSKF